MANVCNVPLSYLFLRGQGIKIYSLVTKMCRQFKFLVPSVTRNNDEETPAKITKDKNQFILINSITYEGITENIVWDIYNNKESMLRDKKDLPTKCKLPKLRLVTAQIIDSYIVKVTNYNYSLLIRVKYKYKKKEYETYIVYKTVKQEYELLYIKNNPPDLIDIFISRNNPLKGYYFENLDIDIVKNKLPIDINPESKYVIMSNVTYNYSEEKIDKNGKKSKTDEIEYNTNIMWKTFVTYDNSYIAGMAY